MGILGGFWDIFEPKNDPKSAKMRSDPGPRPSPDPPPDLFKPTIQYLIDIVNGGADVSRHVLLYTTPPAGQM